MKKRGGVWSVVVGCVLACAARDRMPIRDWGFADADEVRAAATAAGWLTEDNAPAYLEGRRLSRVGEVLGTWRAATVPGTILTSLVNLGVYPEPCWGENNRPEVIPESLCRHDWWYRTEVEIPPEYAGRRVWLELDGINYAAEIHVNGRFVGRLKGAFVRGKFDISEYNLKYGKPNAIAIRVSPQPTPGNPNEHTMGTHGGPCGGVARYDGPTFSCSVGWDWQGGVRDRNTGLWQGVYLSATGAAVLDDPRITTDLPDLPSRARATVRVAAPVRNVTDRPVAGTLKVAFNGAELTRAVTLPPWGETNVVFTSATDPALEVKSPKLWWPNGLGEPTLQRMELSFACDGRTSDARTETFGIRKFQYFTPGKKAFELSVNGVKVFLKGGNWGLDEFLKRIDPARIDAQVRYHRDCNFNMIRNWGGQSYSDALADACDKYGILLWQEFWHMDAMGPRDTDLYLANLRDTVKRYRNRASIPFWCALNEATPPTFLNNEIRRTLRELDPERHYQPNSGNFWGFNSGGPYEWLPPVKYSRYLEVPSFNRHETFKTELGAVAIPTLESLAAMFPADGLAGMTDAWGEANFAAGGGRSYLRYMKARYGAPRNVADFVRKAQLMNYEAHRAMYEGRLARMFEPAEGVLLWMSIPSHPCLIWNLVSYDLEPHAAYYAVQAACRPVHALFTETDGGTVTVANHLPGEVAGRVEVTVYALDGRELGREVRPFTAKGEGATTLGRVAWPAELPTVHFVRVARYDARGALAEDGFYWRRTDTNPADVKDLDDTNRLVYREDLTALEAMPTVTLEAACKKVVQIADGATEVEVTLKNPTKHLAHLVHVQLRAGVKGPRVLPAFCDDNYVTLAPGATKRLRITCATRALQGAEPTVAVDGWNVRVAAANGVWQNDDMLPAAPRWAAQEGFGFTAPELAPQEVVRINCGGYNCGNFAKDPGFLEGACGYQIEPVDLSGAQNPAPADVYRSVRWSGSTYVCRMTRQNAPYLLRLHFAESSQEKVAGVDRFDVKVNGRVVLPDFDVAAAAGGINRAVSVDVPGVRSDAEGRVVVTFEGGRKKGGERHRDPRVCGIEVLPK